METAMLVGNKSRYYVLARTADEAERLHQQSTLWREATAAILDQIGVSPGMSCLDVGCGGGDVLVALGERVGPTGQVCGLDIDSELGQRIVRQLNGTMGAQFSFVEGDITDSSTVPSGPFDVTAARFLLLHLKDPIAALRTLWTRTKAGGVMMVIDYDLGTLDCYPDYPPLREFFRVVKGVFTKSGLDPRIGSRLPSYFEQSGAGPPDGIRPFCLMKPVVELRGFILSCYLSFLPAALRLGITTHRKSEALIRTLETISPNHRTYLLSGLYLGVWKRKRESL